METFSRLFFGLTENQPLKADINKPIRNIDIENVEHSDCAQSEEMAQAIGRLKTPDRSKATLLKRTDELHNPQQHYNEPSNAHRHQQLDKREVADTKKPKTELEGNMQKRSEVLRKTQERHSSSVREPKARVDNVEELALAKKTVDNLKETVRKLEANYRTDQREMTGLKTALEKQKADLDKATGLKAAAEHNSERLHSELETTWRQLQLCKDDLFRLQPRAQTPDTEIVIDFESTCQDVIGWIDMEIFTFEKSYPGAGSGHVFSGGTFPEVVHLLQQFPTFGEYFVRYVVHRCLNDTMFSRSVYLLGLAKEVKQCLQAAEERMARLEPPRDSKTINTWRSETLTAIAATPDLAVNRETEIKKVLERIFQSVCQFFPIICLQAQSKQRLLNQVVLPAAKLASKIQVAASIYEFYLPTHFKHNQVSIDDHKTMRMIDVKTRKTIKGSSAIVQAGERRIGHLVILLEPSLRRIDETGKSTLLRPEVNLIKLD